MTKERKITGNIKGIVSKYSDNSFEFRPFGKGEPVYEEKQEFKNAASATSCSCSSSMQDCRSTG